MVQARPFEIEGVVVPGHYVIIADDVVLLQADYNIVAMKRDGKIYIDTTYWDSADVTAWITAKFLGVDLADVYSMLHFRGGVVRADLNNGDLIR